MRNHPEAPAAFAAAMAAGSEILRIYDSDFAVDYKSDDSPLTLADRNAHSIIERKLRTEFPEIPVLSEEGADIPYAERSEWKVFWLVDPLDGTKEFVNRNGEFTVNIALMSDNRPVLGVIYIPVEDVLYLGDARLGSYRVKDASGFADDYDAALDAATQLPEDYGDRPFTIVSSRSHGNAATEEYIAGLRGRYADARVIGVGSSIKFCRVAEGKADVYPRFAPSREWDTAAGEAICLGAGCVVRDADGGGLIAYNKKIPRSPSFVVDAPRPGPNPSAEPRTGTDNPTAIQAGRPEIQDEGPRLQS